jgi:hypothetical protein
MIYKPIENKFNSNENKIKEDEKKDYEFEDSESVRMIQKEIYGEDEEIEDNLIAKNINNIN